MGEPLIIASRLRKRFSGRDAVYGVSFKVAAGEVAAFLGPNGAGKTTTLRMLSGALEPDAGRAAIAGFDVSDARRLAQAELGYLPEGAPLFAETNPKSFLKFIATARGLSGAAKAAGVARAMEAADLQSVARQTIHTLSKGYRRRVALAAAIVHDPPVLILDEPTDGLDPNQKRDVRALIQRLAETKAVLVSTHSLEEVEAVCSRVLLIHHGRIIADETPAAFAARGDGDLDAAFAALTRPTDAAA